MSPSLSSDKLFILTRSRYCINERNMMESEGLNLLEQLLGFWSVFVVAPLTAWLKHQDWTFNEIVRPEFIGLLLAVGGAFGLVEMLSYSYTAEATIRLGLQASGIAGVTYGTGRIVLKARDRRKKNRVG